MKYAIAIGILIVAAVVIAVLVYRNNQKKIEATADAAVEKGSDVLQKVKNAADELKK